MVLLPQFLVIRNDRLELFYQPIDNNTAQEEQQAERRQEQPAVIHAGGVVHSG